MILVTGATGFLGKRICKKLENKNLEHCKTSLSLGCDLRQAQEIFSVFDEIKPEYVLHCASYVGGLQFGLKHPTEIFSNNLLMTINLLEACKKYKVKRLVNPISNCAYPGKASLFKEEEFWDGPLHESVLVYGMVRKMSWVGSYAYAKQFSLDTINIILSNMYGPEDHFEEERSHAMGALIMKIIKAKSNNEPEVIVWGTGKPVREWLYVDDGAEAMIRALNIKSYNQPINIGVAKGLSIEKMAYMIKELVGYEGNLYFDSSKTDGAPYKTVDGTIGAELLKWKPEIEIEEGIQKTIEWYYKNKFKEDTKCQ